jgi:plastocyanin
MQRRLTRIVATAATGALAVALAGSGALASTPAKSGKPKVVKVKQFNFKPKTITVSVGDTVKWKNKDDILHTVTSKEEVFDEDLDGAGSSAKVSFDDPGTYEYFCSRHTGMNGTVIVEK